MKIQENDRVTVSGYTDELWISDYHCRVSSGATVMETPSKNAKKVIVNIDEIDGDRNVCVSVRCSMLSKK